MGLDADGITVSALMTEYAQRTGLTIRVAPGEPLSLGLAEITGTWSGDGETVFDDAIGSVDLEKVQVNASTWHLQPIP